MSKPAGTELSLTIDTALNKPAMPMSEYLLQNRERLFNDVNPEMERPLYNQNMDIFWPAFADYAIAHPMNLGPLFLFYAQTMGRDILELFSITRTQTNHVIQAIMSVDKIMVPVSTRKTPPQIISTKVTNVGTYLQLRAQGFSVDYYHMKTPEGRANWDAHMNQLFYNFIATIKLSSISTIENTPSFYRHPSQLYAWSKRAPISPTEVYEFDQVGFCPLSKQTLGFESLAMQVNAIMGREGESFSRLVLSRDDEFLIRSNDAGRLFVPFAGPSAIANRQAGGPAPGKVNSKGSSLMGIEFIVIPLLDSSLHNNSDNKIFRSNIQTGSKWSFWDETADVPASEFVSCMRDTHVASWKTNEMDVYRLDSAFAKCPQFYQIRGHWSRNSTDPITRFRDEYNGSVLSITERDSDTRLGGRINRKWLHLLAVRSRIEFARAKTIQESNEEELDVLLCYNHTIQPFDPNVTKASTSTAANTFASAKALRQRGGAVGRVTGNVSDVVTKWTPVNMIMEISEKLTATGHLRLCYATMANAIFKNVSNAEMRAFCEGMKWIDECSKLPVNEHSIVSLLDTFGLPRAVTNIAPLYNRSTVSTYASGSGNTMLVPNRFGGLNLGDLSAIKPLSGASKYKNSSTMYLPGFANISGIYTLNEALGKSASFSSYFSAFLKPMLEKFIVVFEKIHRNILDCVYCNVAVDPRLIPMVHDSPDMSDMMRSRIVTWYNVFTTYAAPLCIESSTPTTREEIIKNALALSLGSTPLNFGTLKQADTETLIRGKKLTGGLNDTDVNAHMRNAGMSTNITVPDFVVSISVYKMFFAKNSLKNFKTDTQLENALYDFDAIKLAPGAASIKYVFQHFSTFLLISNIVCSGAPNEEALVVFKNVAKQTDVKKNTILVLPLTSSFNNYGTRVDVVFGSLDVIDPFDFIMSEGDRKEGAIQTGGSGSYNVPFLPLHHVFLQTYYVEALNVTSAAQESGFNVDDMWLNFGTFMTSNSIKFGPDTNMAGHKVGVTVSDTLLGAGPYIDPMLPNQSRLINVRNETLHKMLSRSNDISRSWVKSLANVDTHFFQYTNMFPAAQDSVTYESYLANRFYEDNLYTESSFDKLKAAFPRYPDAFLHNVVYPLSGNPMAIKNNDGQLSTTKVADVPDSQMRYMATHSYSIREAIGARLVLFQEPCAQMACIWREKNIRIPFDVTVLRPREHLTTRAMGAVSDGYIGSLYLSDIVTLLDFSANIKQYQFQMEMREGTLINEPRKFYVIPHVCGGRLIGGKGNDWYFNAFELPSHEAYMDSHTMQSFRAGAETGESMGNNSNFAVLQGYNHAFKRKELSVYTDITGHSDYRDFVGRLESCKEFNSDQDTPMMEGLFFHNMVMDWGRGRDSGTDVPTDHQSYREVSNTRMMNFHCLQTTQYVYSRLNGYATVPSAHLFGEQLPGLREKESGNARIGYVDS